MICEAQVLHNWGLCRRIMLLVKRVCFWFSGYWSGTRQLLQSMSLQHQQIPLRITNALKWMSQRSTEAPLPQLLVLLLAFHPQQQQRYNSYQQDAKACLLLF
jgi:hypothetical protein